LNKTEFKRQMAVPRLLWFPLFFASWATAQPLHLGIKVGVPFTDFFVPGAGGDRSCLCSARYSSVPHRFTAGPTIEAGLPFGFSAEVDLLYKRFNYSWVGSSAGPAIAAAGLTTGNAWEIPLLLKRRFSSWPARPYVGAGPVVRHVTGLHQAINEVLRGDLGGLSFRRVESDSPGELRKRWYPGVSVGGGIEGRLGVIRISPEIRYTRWTANSPPRYAPGYGLYFHGNQIEVLLGVSFSKREHQGPNRFKK
jgi:hypothetical protein